jgi:dTDP-4-amino-4,6-dideoxygalactose transaminase
MALKALDVKAGDEVIVPTYTWTATAACAVYVNAVPVFADVTPDNYTIDPKHVESLITEKTKVIIPVHLGSSIADMDALLKIAKKHNLTIIEDCAHMHGAKWNGKGVGSIGDLGSFSFQSSKLMTAGEGGILTTSDDMLSQKCHSLVNCGRKEPGYDEFEGHMLGYNYRISEFQAAVLVAQLEKLDDYTEERSANATYLTELLDDIDGIGTIKPDKRTTQSAHYQYIFKYNPEEFGGLHRDKFLEAMMAEGIMLDGDFYTPIPTRKIFTVMADEWPMIRDRYGDKIHLDNEATPVATKAAYEEAVWMHYPMLMSSRADLEDIALAIRKIQKNVDELDK